MHKLPLRGGREGGDRDGREARASKSNFLFLKKERVPTPSEEGPKERGRSRAANKKKPKRGREEVLLACQPA